MTLRLAPLFFVLALVPACGGPAEAPDASVPATDGAIDAAPSDGALPDGDRPDGDRRDAQAIDAPPDARPAIDAGMPIEALRDGYCRAFAEATCRDRFDCGCGDGRGGAPDVEACIAGTISFCADELRARLGPYFADGRLRVDEAVIDTCRARIEASFGACAGTTADVAQWCQGMLIESTPIGGGCLVSEALCADGSGTCAGGSCERLPALGAACVGPGQCAAGLTCRDGSCAELSDDGEPCTRDGNCAGELVCAGGACRASRAAIGAACAVDGECVARARCESSVCAAATSGACDDDADCGSLERCEMRFGRLCREASPVGSPCTSSNGCTPDAYCDDSVSFPGVCQLRRPAGMPCPLGDAQCEATAVCDFSTGAPICRAPSGPGEACFATGIRDRDGCLPDLACVMGTCVTFPGSGELCGDDGECAPGLACRTGPTGERRCGGPGSLGEPCEPFRGGGYPECGPGLFCDGSTGFGSCQPQRGVSEPCTGSLGECHDGLSCIARSDGTATCAPIPGAGEECADECSGGLVCADGTLPGACYPAVCDEIPGGGMIDPPPPPPRP